jgi:alpha-mannosidase
MGGEASQRAPSSYPKLVTRPVGQRPNNIYTDRLGQFTAGGQYGRYNLTS